MTEITPGFVKEMLMRYIAGQYMPPESAIKSRLSQEQTANPHGDSYKPARHSYEQIVIILKFEHARKMMEFKYD